jgi:hypothetical protein
MSYYEVPKHEKQIIPMIHARSIRGSKRDFCTALHRHTTHTYV